MYLYEQFHAKIYNYISVVNVYNIVLFFCSVFALLVLALKCKRKNSSGTICFKDIIWCIFYAAWMTLTGFITLFGRSHSVSTDYPMSLFLSFFELLNGNNGIIYDLLFNMVLFIPCGYLLRLRMNTIITFQMIFMTSLIIETAQLMTKRGVFEISDLLTNTFGGLIGLLATVTIIKIRRKDCLK